MKHENQQKEEDRMLNGMVKSINQSKRYLEHSEHKKEVQDLMKYKREEKERKHQELWDKVSEKRAQSARKTMRKMRKIDDRLESNRSTLSANKLYRTEMNNLQHMDI